MSPQSHHKFLSPLPMGSTFAVENPSICTKGYQVGPIIEFVKAVSNPTPKPTSIFPLTLFTFILNNFLDTQGYSIQIHTTQTSLILKNLSPDIHGISHFIRVKRAGHRRIVALVPFEFKEENGVLLPSNHFFTFPKFEDIPFGIASIVKRFKRGIIVYPGLDKS